METTHHSARTRRAVTDPQQFPPLELVNRPAIPTEQAAHYLSRRPQTLRGWACLGRGPLRPLEKLRSIGTEEAVNDPQHGLLFLQLHRSAPPRYRQEVDVILADAMPPTTHVNDDGQAVFSIEQMAAHFGKTPEEVAADVDRMVAEGLIDPAAMHTGPAHPLQ